MKSPAAITAADGLVSAVMADRGYPIDDFDQRAADVSVDHPAVVENYRQANEISSRSARGAATTEDLRQAMRNYRSLFEELLADDTADKPLARDTENEVSSRPNRSERKRAGRPNCKDGVAMTQERELTTADIAREPPTTPFQPKILRSDQRP